MANTEISKIAPKLPQRATDVFSVMRDEMDRMFERFESGLPRLPNPFRHGSGDAWLMPELDVHDNGKQLTVAVELPGVDEKDVAVNTGQWRAHDQGREKVRAR